jgi:dihydrofolate reductase
VQRFLRARCIDTLTITTIPILLGHGKPLFGQLDADVALELVSSVAYPFGFVQSTYRVLRAATL